MSQGGKADAASSRPVGYWSLLRDNAPYRRLWLGLVVGMTGDWFRTIALYLLVLRLTGASGLALGGVVIAETLSIFVMSPLAGVLADRFSRKAIMIAADLVRAILALGFLLITSADRVWLAYVLSATLMGVSAFFYPAYTATIPNLTARAQLVTANALSSATWASILALGSALGGVVAARFGAQTAFLIDAGTFVVSALFIATVPIPAGQNRLPDLQKAGTNGGLQAFWQGLDYIRTHPRVMWLLSVKTCGMGVAGGMLLLFALFAEQVFQAGAVGLGILSMTRGLGATIGPILARRVAGEEPHAMSRAIGIAFLVTGGFYIVFSRMPTLIWAAIALFVAYMASSVLWVFSSTLLQIMVPDTYRGRVFAADFALFTVMMAVSTFLTGLGVDQIGFTPRTLAAFLGALLLIPGLLWLFPRSRRATAVD